MIIVKSNEYTLVGYDTDRNLWHFERLAPLVGDTLKEILLVGQAKFVDNANNLVIHCNSGGDRVLKQKKY